MSQTTQVLVALVAGLAAGMLVASLGPDVAGPVVAASEPVGALFVAAIRMTVVPLVIGSLVVAVASGDARIVGRVGRRALIVALALLAAAALFAALLGPPAMSLIPIGPEVAAALRASAPAVASDAAAPTLGRWIVDLVPTNPVKAAADGAMLPLIVFTVLFALALGRLSMDQREPVLAFFRGIADASLLLVRWVLLLAPIGVFALAVPLAVRAGAAAAGAVAGYVVVVSALVTLFALLVLYPAAIVIGRVRPGDFARASLPAQAVAFSARSSLAALPAMIAGARVRLGLPDAVSSFLLPIAASTLRVGGAIGQTAMVLFAARLYGVSLDAGTIATVATAVAVMTFGVPGIPGGSVIVLVPLLATAGVPTEAVGLLMGVDAIPDMFRTTANVTADMTTAAIVGRGETEIEAEAETAPAARTA